MEILKFTLSGKTAFFKKPDVNEYAYFTFGNIHKVALLGIFGAILGYNGYNQMTKEQNYPEFYQRLKELKIAIVPSQTGYFMKKIHTFNNSVGYASREQGGNLIVRQQWLHDPKWEIYVLIDQEEAENLKDAMLHHQCCYVPYLGANDHYADINHVKVIDDGIKAENITHVDSLCKKSDVNLNIESEEILFPTYKYEEFLPIGLDEFCNQYIMEPMIYTDFALTTTSDLVYCVDNKNISFF